MSYDIDYFNHFITNYSSYFAHLPKETESSRRPELLSEHSALVYSYANTIVQKQELNDIIENLIGATIPEGMNTKLLQSLIGDLFKKSIAYHDLGKVNKNLALC